MVAPPSYFSPLVTLVELTVGVGATGVAATVVLFFFLPFLAASAASAFFLFFSAFLSLY